MAYGSWSQTHTGVAPCMLVFVQSQLQSNNCDKMQTFCRTIAYKSGKLFLKTKVNQ